MQTSSPETQNGLVDCGIDRGPHEQQRAIVDVYDMARNLQTESGADSVNEAHFIYMCHLLFTHGHIRTQSPAQLATMEHQGFRGIKDLYRYKN
jgi:hypothetical protein